MSGNRKYSSYTKRHRRYLVATETQDDLDRFRYVDDDDDDNIQFCEDLEEVTAIHHASTADNLQAASSSSQSNSDNSLSKSDVTNNESDVNNMNSDSDIENWNSDDNPLSDDEDYGCDWFREDNNMNAAGNRYECHDLLVSNDEIQSSEFMSDLRWWAIKYRICLNAISDLLQILKKHIPILSFLPIDARTFLRTPRESNIINLAGGLYWHCGLRNFIEKLIIDYEKLALPSNIDLILNVDGLPLAKSSKVSFWPILVSDIKLKNVYMVGCYYGDSKPSNANDFVKEFVHDLISINNKLHVQVSLYAIVCDAPAKSFLLSTKGHIGYGSCSKCYIQGVHKNNKVCFVENVPSRLRSDTDFLEQTDVDYHKGETILTIVPNLGLVTNVPLDYMHLICLGVVKKLLVLWIKGPLSVRLNSTQIQKISDFLIKIKQRTPTEFVRKPRSLNDVMYWKATEFRQFLLYTGPVVLNGLIRQDIYINFLTLHVAISILINPKLIKNQNNILYAEKLLIHFVKSFQIIYGERFVTHNVHNLLHLSRDVQKFGALDEFSAFRFENYLQMLKNILRKSDKPLQQVARRFGEMHASEYQFHSKLDNQSNTILKNKHCSGPLPNNIIMQNNFNQYKILKTHLYYINCKEDKNNCCVLKDGSIICVLNIIQLQNLEIFIIGVKCKKLNTLYSLPCSSGKLNIHFISKTTEMSLWPITEIEGKLYNLLNSKNKSIAIPLCHADV